MEENLQSMVAEFFAEQDTEWYSAGIYKLISRYNKCLNEQSDYVESRKFCEESNKRCFEALFFYLPVLWTAWHYFRNVHRRKP